MAREPGERDDGHVHVSTGEPRGSVGEDAVARADGHVLEPLCHALILQDVEQGQVGPVLARPPEMPRGWESEGDRGAAWWLQATMRWAASKPGTTARRAETTISTSSLVGLGVAVRFSMSIKISCRLGRLIRVFVISTIIHVHTYTVNHHAYTASTGMIVHLGEVDSAATEGRPGGPPGPGLRGGSVALSVRAWFEGLGDDLDGAPLGTVGRFPGAGLLATLDVGEAALRHVLGGELGVLAPEDDVVELGPLRSLVAMRTVVTLTPDAVVRSSGSATSRPTRITRLTDVPAKACWSRRCRWSRCSWWFGACLPLDVPPVG